VAEAVRLEEDLEMVVAEAVRLEVDLGMAVAEYPVAAMVTAMGKHPVAKQAKTVEELIKDHLGMEESLGKVSLLHDRVHLVEG
jgi:hypothetical protein